ncbi:uncharacterized protein LOC119367471 [Triticum dicoccoides]|uniref:uncharacterized protein LOC119367471 n=1 Tax=Triticum dicoccoides TaxID=85692 RepID=UPI00188E4B03|nr:uncharacterized protein LOC119367471 [Triticum dicoccoides]XP_044319580.1 uncharacterized protein LOC123040928 [Triticum aestivum]
MLRSATGFALRRKAPAPRFSSHGGRSSPGCSCTTKRMYSGDGMNESKSTMADDIKRTIASFCEKTGWKGKDLLFGCIAGALMCTYKYNATGAGILGYRFDEVRKEREARKQRAEADKNNIDISFC